MRGCFSSPTADTALPSSSSSSTESMTVATQEARSRALDRVIRQDEKRMQKEVKLLLLGAGESGKSTMLRSMRIVHAVPFTAQEVEHFRRLIFANLVDGMLSLLASIEEQGGQLADPSNLTAAGQLIDGRPRMEIEQGHPYPAVYHGMLQRLWQDAQVQRAVAQGHRAAIPDNLPYYFTQLDRLFAPTFVPDQDDILHCRNKTTGIVETSFPIGDKMYRIFDVGGQRSERKKWIHCFYQVTAVFFVVALSGYDACLTEDHQGNQMEESLRIFDDICNNQYFTRTSMILFLNKLDLFREKVESQRCPIQPYFPDFPGPEGDVDVARRYFRQRFLALNRSKTKEIYPAFTNATDPDLLKVVMASVTDIILTNHMRGTLL